MQSEDRESVFMEARWQAAEETSIGGWCVQPEGASPTHEGGEEVACFVYLQDAEHIADLHNAWLEARKSPLERAAAELIDEVRQVLANDRGSPSDMITDLRALLVPEGVR